ncbi:MAG: GTPase [Enterococcus sp.]
MEEKDNFLLATFTKKSEEFLNQVEETLKEVNYNTNKLPRNIYNDNKPISLVFAGQYSAGKSTILKALTGIQSIETGEKITTQKSHEYDWHGLKVVDTPGIHTTLHPEHDEISYKAIVDADMLVYVVTQELFDLFIGDNFRKLLLDQDKAAEMILVVNKMAVVGNTTEMRKIKLDNLRIVTSPYEPEQLHTCFVDAESYLESLDEEDDDIAEELKIRSNYDGLVKTIDSFVKENALYSKLTTSLYKIDDVLQDAISEFSPSSGDADVDALEERLLQERRIASSTEWRIEQQAKTIYQNIAGDIRDKDRVMADKLYDYSSEDEANSEINKSEQEVEELTNSCVAKITELIDEITNDEQTQLDEFYNSEFSKTLEFRLKDKLKKKNPIVEKIFKSDILVQGGQKIVAGSVGKETAGLNGLKVFAQSDVHEAVLNVGHLFGHSFKPWEAVKWAKGINYAGKALGVLGVVFSIGLQAKEDIDEDTRQQQMRQNREKLRAGYNDVADGVSYHFEKAVRQFLDKNYKKRINELDTQINEIRKLRQGKTESYDLLLSTQKQCKNLISDIHNVDN